MAQMPEFPEKDELRRQLQYALLSYGLGKMKEPMDRVQRLITEKHCNEVAVICPERYPRTMVSKLLKGYNVSVIQAKSLEKLGATPEFRISIPPLKERLEDLPLITEYVIQNHVKIHGLASPVLSDLYLLSMLFMCTMSNSSIFLSTPIQTLDEYVSYLKLSLDEQLYAVPADAVFEFDQIVEFDKKKDQRIEIKRTLRPLGLLEDETVDIHLSQVTNHFAYQHEDNELHASIIAGETTYTAHLRVLASGDFRHFLAADKNPAILKQLATKKLSLSELQENLLRLGREYIPDFEQLKITILPDVLGGHYRSMNTNSDVLQGMLVLHESDSTVMYRNKKYCLPSRQYNAVRFLVTQAKKGNYPVKKNAVFDEAYEGHDVPEGVPKKSVVKWFREQGGDALKFAEDKLIVTDESGTCRLSVDPSFIKIVEAD